MGIVMPGPRNCAGATIAQWVQLSDPPVVPWNLAWTRWYLVEQSSLSLPAVSRRGAPLFQNPPSSPLSTAQHPHVALYIQPPPTFQASSLRHLGGKLTRVKRCWGEPPTPGPASRFQSPQSLMALKACWQEFPISSWPYLPPTSATSPTYTRYIWTPTSYTFSKVTNTH